MEPIKRSWAELIGPTTIRFHHPCGHNSTKDFNKGPIPKRMGAAACRMMASWWSKEKSGVHAKCPICTRNRHPAEHV